MLTILTYLCRLVLQGKKPSEWGVIVSVEGKLRKLELEYESLGVVNTRLRCVNVELEEQRRALESENKRLWLENEELRKEIGSLNDELESEVNKGLVDMCELISLRLDNQELSTRYNELAGEYRFMKSEADGYLGAAVAFQGEARRARARLEVVTDDLKAAETSRGSEDLTPTVIVLGGFSSTLLRD